MQPKKASFLKVYLKKEVLAMEITNLDLVKEFVKFIKSAASLDEVIKEYGGCSIYIPSYKTVYRNDEIRVKYLEMRESKATNIALHLAREYDVTTRQIYTITQDLR
jgi:Mor family transcriptional regulator